MNELINTNASMTSLEISELVGSRHTDVKRSIERLAVSGVIRKPPTAFSENINNLGFSVEQALYVFEGEEGKRDSIIVVAQLSPEFTARLVDRWKELEDERRKPKSQAEIIAAMALANLESERRISSVEEKVEQVHEVVEQIKQGAIPVGYQGYSYLCATYGISNAKCRQLVKGFNIPSKRVPHYSPNGQVTQMTVVHDESFKRELELVMREAELKGARWYHPKMGLFQAIGWEEK